MKKRALPRLAAMGIAAFMLSSGVTAQDRTVLFGSVVQPDGTVAPKMAVVIVGQKVEAVVAADSAKTGPKDVVVRFDQTPDVVISPGLIDLRSSAGAMNDTSERKQTVDPTLAAIEGVSFSDRFFATALQSGVTAVMVSPSEANIVGGVAATFRTNPRGSVGDVLRSDGPMTFNLGTSVLDNNRGPTSRSGVLTILRDAMAAAKKAGESDKTNTLARVTAKKLDALVVCESAEDVDAAARTFGEYGLRPNLVLGADAMDVADELSGSDIAVVIGPLTFGSSMKALMGPARLDQAGLEVAFAGRMPMVEPAGLRVTAALAVRYGLDPAQARRGMTRNAARVAGVSDRIGTLEAGKDADVVIFSGDPLRLDAKVMQVYIKGERAYERATGPSDADAGWAE